MWFNFVTFDLIKQICQFKYNNMGKTIIQICVNPETHKCIYLTDFKDGILHYRVSTDIKVPYSEVVEYEDDNVIIGSYFFHKSFLDKFIEGNQ